MGDKKPKKCQRCGKTTDSLEKHRKKPGYKGGEYEGGNIQWLCHECHESVTRNRGEFSYGGDKKQKNLKRERGEKGFKEYQENAGKARQQKLRDELGEEGYSRKQRENINKRWHNKKGGTDMSWKDKFANNITKEAQVLPVVGMEGIDLSVIDFDLKSAHEQLFECVKTILESANKASEITKNTPEFLGLNELFESIKTNLVNTEQDIMAIVQGVTAKQLQEKAIAEQQDNNQEVQ